MIQLVAFDWNGTLFADTRAVVKATNRSRSFYGYPPISLKQYQKTFTIPILDFWLANGGKKEDLITEHDRFHSVYESLISNTRTRKGTKEILIWLRRNHIPSIIYSNHTLKEIINQLRRLKIDIFFEAVLARRGVEDQIHLHQKNKGTKLSDYIKTRRLRPDQILTIGDTCEEVEIGHNLKIWTVAIIDGETDTARLKQMKPNFLIHNLKELISIIKKLNNL
jgi:phosphoglycolate phosphatase